MQLKAQHMIMIKHLLILIKFTKSDVLDGKLLV